MSPAGRMGETDCDCLSRHTVCQLSQQHTGAGRAVGSLQSLTNNLTLTHQERGAGACGQGNFFRNWQRTLRIACVCLTDDLAWISDMPSFCSSQHSWLVDAEKVNNLAVLINMQQYKNTPNITDRAFKSHTHRQKNNT